MACWQTREDNYKTLNEKRWNDSRLELECLKPTTQDSVLALLCSSLILHYRSSTCRCRTHSRTPWDNTSERCDACHPHPCSSGRYQLSHETHRDAQDQRETLVTPSGSQCPWMFQFHFLPLAHRWSSKHTEGRRCELTPHGRDQAGRRGAHEESYNTWHHCGWNGG